MQLEQRSFTFSQLPNHDIAVQTWGGMRQCLGVEHGIVLWICRDRIHLRGLAGDDMIILA